MNEARKNRLISIIDELIEEKLEVDENFLRITFFEVRVKNGVKEDEEKEFMLLGLRTIKGVSIQDFKSKFGKNPIFLFRKELGKLVEEDLIQIDLDEISLTEKGLDLANLVWEEFV